MKLTTLHEAKYAGDPRTSFDAFVIKYFTHAKSNTHEFNGVKMEHLHFKAKPEYIIKVKNRSNKSQQVAEIRFVFAIKDGERKFEEIQAFKTTGGAIKRKFNQAPEKLFMVYEKTFG